MRFFKKYLIILGRIIGEITRKLLAFGETQVKAIGSTGRTREILVVSEMPCQLVDRLLSKEKVLFLNKPITSEYK